MKTLIVSLTFALFTQTLFSQTDSNGWAYCSSNYRAAGGVKAVIPIYTNDVDGTSIVLPIRVKMCDEVLGNPEWNIGYDFGPKVKILPEMTVDVSPGYIYYGPPDFDGQPHYTYSSKYPILIEATITGDSWFTNYYLCLYAARSQDGLGPCQVAAVDNHMGLVQGKLYCGSNTNGLDTWTTYGPNVTNSLMGRFGVGSCDNRYDDSNSRNAVAFLYFNLPTRPYTRVSGGYTYLCQDGTNFFQYPYTNGVCGFTPDYSPGFIYGWNEDNCQNWSNYPAPCDTNLYAEKLFRVRCDGNTNCQDGGVTSLLKRKLTR